MNSKDYFETIKKSAMEIIRTEPALTDLMQKMVLAHTSLEHVMSAILAEKVAGTHFPIELLQQVFYNAYQEDLAIVESAIFDLEAFVDRDPATKEFIFPLFFYKGFQSIQIYRVSHYLWKKKNIYLALYLQSKTSEIFGVDIHPAARIGHGILLDHATSFVVGETSVIDNNVSILHEVTLGGTGKEEVDRHPKIKEGALLGAGAKILGNITVGKNAKVGAGSVVLHDVPDHTTVVGVPAKVVGEVEEDIPAILMDHSSYIKE